MRMTRNKNHANISLDMGLSITLAYSTTLLCISVLACAGLRMPDLFPVPMNPETDLPHHGPF